MTSSLEPDLCPPQVTQIPLETGPAAVLDGKDRTLPACPAAKAKHRTWQAVGKKRLPNPVLVSYENENHQCINVAIIFTHHTKLLASAAPWNDHQLQLSNGVSTAACKMRPGNQLLRPPVLSDFQALLQMIMIDTLLISILFYTISLAQVNFNAQQLKTLNTRKNWKQAKSKGLVEMPVNLIVLHGKAAHEGIIGIEFVRLDVLTGGTSSWRNVTHPLMALSLITSLFFRTFQSRFFCRKSCNVSFVRGSYVDKKGQSLSIL